jgi:hypothetical protein
VPPDGTAAGIEALWVRRDLTRDEWLTRLGHVEFASTTHPVVAGRPDRLRRKPLREKRVSGGGREDRQIEGDAALIRVGRSTFPSAATAVATALELPPDRRG